MVSVKRLFVFLALAALAFSLTSCASMEPEDNPNQVSSQPWNRPQKWEGPGTLGGIMNSY